MTERLAIVGAGIAGRLVALRLAAPGRAVTLFEAGRGDAGCSFAAAGMLAPAAEAAAGEALIGRLGARSLALWPKVLGEIGEVPFHTRGTVVAIRPGDEAELADLLPTLERRAPWASIRREADVASLEPGLGGDGLGGILIEGEGQIDNRAALDALRETLARRDVAMRFETRVAEIAAGRVDGETYDWVFDCRGLAAQDALPSLRGVRGEAVILEAPEVALTRPVRVLHPRYPIYVAPRGPRRFVVGATQVESASRAPMTVRSALELLTAAYDLAPGFRSAQIVELVADARPTFFDHRPRVLTTPGLTRVNGLFRHGFLLGPLVAEVAAAALDGGTLDEDLRTLTVDVA